MSEAWRGLLPAVALGLLLALAALLALVFWSARVVWRKRAQVADRLRPVVGALLRSAALRPLVARRPAWLGPAVDRLLRHGHLGLHLLLGVTASAVAAVLFGAVAQDVLTHGELRVLDLPLAQWLHAHATDSGAAGQRALSTLGSVTGIAILTAVVAIPLAVRHRWRELAAWLAANGGAGLLVLLLKFSFRRDRPSFADPFVYEPTSSFPSGHSLGALVAWGMLARLLAGWTTSDAARAAAIALCAFIVLGVGFTRLYLGAHYLTDVLAGFAAGAVWLATSITALRVLQRTPRGQAPSERYLRR